MSHYLGLCVSFKGKNDFSNFVSVQQLGTLVGRRRIAMNLGMSIKYHADVHEIGPRIKCLFSFCFQSLCLQFVWVTSDFTYVS